jgi:hypothetical protein
VACVLEESLAELATAAEAQDGEAIRALLMRLVPEYAQPEGDRQDGSGPNELGGGQ